MIFGIILIAGGIAVIVYTKQVGDFTGAIGWVEKYFGQGSTYSFIKFVGIFLIFFAFAWMSGGLEDFIWNKFGLLFGRGQEGL